MDTAVPPSPKGQPTHAYSLDEIKRMLLVIPEPASTVIGTAALTGLRRGELQAMRWENLRDGAYQVAGSIWNGKETEPKTNASASSVPIIPYLAALLRNHRLRQCNPVAGPMFPGPSGRPISMNNLLNRVIKPALNPCAGCSEPKDKHADAEHEYVLDASLPRWMGGTHSGAALPPTCTLSA